MRMSDWRSVVCSSDLEEGVAALGVAEGLDVEGHERPSPRQAPKRRSFLVQAEKAWRRSSRFSTASSVSQLSWIERRCPTKGLWPCQASGVQRKATSVPASGDRKSTRLNSSH